MTDILRLDVVVHTTSTSTIDVRFFVSGMEATPASAPRANAAKRGAASGPKKGNSIVFSKDA